MKGDSSKGHTQIEENSLVPAISIYFPGASDLNGSIFASPG